MSDETVAPTLFAERALRVPNGHYDLVILGGGLAGLTLALQLSRERPDTRILVAEKRAYSPPDAAFKVGESTVEVGAHYYREVCGLRSHLEDKQIAKAGLRYFFPAGDSSDITKRAEFVTVAKRDADTHQIDRGRFENELYDRCLKAGVDAVRGWRVEDVELGDPHRVTLSHEQGQAEVTARWVTDATGRANLLRRKLGIGTEVNHHINSAWFRLDGGIDLEEWAGGDEEWLAREPDRGLRALATTHLCGPGYWIWMINLATGPISVGICADPRFIPFERINTLEAFLGWMREHEPQLGAEVEARQDQVLDFLVVEDFAYSSERVISKDRWTLVGEAGAFLDPFYSPGSDYIAHSNTLTTELVKRDLEGEQIDELAELFNDYYFKQFRTTARLYEDSYEIFGNAQVMVAKVNFDAMFYFATNASPFVHGLTRNADDLRGVIERLDALDPLMERMQALFKRWHVLDQRRWGGASVLTKKFEGLIENRRQTFAEGSPEEILAGIEQSIERVKALAVWIFFRAARALPSPPDPGRAIDPFAISLDPNRWDADGLYDRDGMTLAQARELLPGFEEIDLDEREDATQLV